MTRPIQPTRISSCISIVYLIYAQQKKHLNYEVVCIRQTIRMQDNDSCLRETENGDRLCGDDTRKDVREEGADARDRVI